MPLHTDYRPGNFKEVFGNIALVRSLENIFYGRDKKSIPKAFLFSGPSGCGKTTLARIITNELKGQLIELNAANTRGIDTIREIINLSSFKPLFWKDICYLFDEAHQLSKDAQQALLKILEDTPEHIYFFLCSTDPQKIIEPVINRCIHYKVSKLRDVEIKELIISIAEEEKLDLSKEIEDLIIYAAEGIPRRALVLLEQLKGTSNVEDAERIAFDVMYEEEIEIIEICRGLTQNKFKDWKEFIQAYRKLEQVGIETIRRIMFSYFTTCLKGSTKIADIDRFYGYAKAMDFFSDNEEGKLVCAFYEIFKKV